MFLCVLTHQPKETLQNRTREALQTYFKQDKGRRPFLCTVLERRLGTTSKEMVYFWSGFTTFLGEQNHSVDMKGIASDKYFTPSLIYLPNENSLQTSWFNLSQKL